MKDAIPNRLSQPALHALMKILAIGSVRPGPDQLDAVLLKLELQGSLTIPEILLRRELRDLLATKEPRENIWDRLWRP